MRLGTRLLVVVALLAGCASGSTKQAAPSPSAALTSAAPTPSAATPSEAICPNQETGGNCVGLLSEGRHSTAAFSSPFAYTSPAMWSNEEDTNGRYLLLPPGATRTGADNGTTDFIGAYAPIQASARDCSEGGQAGVTDTPAAIAAELATRPGLAATAPRATSLGSLRGTVVDLRLAAGWTRSCPDGDPPFPLVPTIYGGYRPELVGHAVVAKEVIRLYLLAGPSGTVAVELQDATGGAHLASLDAVVQTFTFT